MYVGPRVPITETARMLPAALLADRVPSMFRDGDLSLASQPKPTPSEMFRRTERQPFVVVCGGSAKLGHGVRKAGEVGEVDGRSGIYRGYRFRL
jgi:hypothetical protein